MSRMVDKSDYFRGLGQVSGTEADDPASPQGPARTPEQAVFYELTRKFVETEDDVPDDAKDVLYYTLAVGHHTGVMDCFEPKVACPLDVFDATVADMDEGEAKQKLAGLREFGEIQIDKASAPALAAAVDGLLKKLGFRGSAKAGIDFLDPDFTIHAQEIAWLMRFKDALDRVVEVDAVYLTGRLK